MFKKFRIKHEGFHRLAIVIGILLIPILFWIFVEVITSKRFCYYQDIQYSYQCYIEYFSDSIYWIGRDEMSPMVFFVLIHIPLYCVGYFSVALIFWIKNGFKK